MLSREGVSTRSVYLRPTHPPNVNANHATRSHDPTQHAQTEQFVLCLSHPGGDCRHCTATRCMCLLSTPRGGLSRESPPSPLPSPPQHT